MMCEMLCGLGGIGKKYKGGVAWRRWMWIYGEVNFESNPQSEHPTAIIGIINRGQNLF